MTTNEKTKLFIDKARKIHGDRYDYSLVEYINNRTKIKIKCSNHDIFEQTPDGHLSGSNCSKCVIDKSKLTNEEFIKKAKDIHGDKYDYSISKYTSSKSLIEILCLIHGLFTIIADSHLRGQGCRKCGLMTVANKLRSTTKDFIIKAIKIHGNKYNYDMVNYIDRNTKVIIKCNNGHSFEQTPIIHLEGKGCGICNGGVQLTTKDFIEKAIKIHGHKYYYNFVEYISAKNKVEIICLLHGVFEITPNDHLSGKQGCYKCGKLETSEKLRSNNEDFISKARKIHGDKYNYDLVEYINNHIKVKIQCNKHGIFEQTPQGHLAGKECQNCAFTNYSKGQIQWLQYLEVRDNIQIQYVLNDGEFKVGKYQVDGYCKKSNTVYEYNGNLYHSNPSIYNLDDIHPIKKVPHREIYNKTIEKENYIKSQGYNLVVIWEHDWNKIIKSIKKIQRWYRQIKK